MINRTSEIIAAEIETHEVLTPWVAEHNVNSNGIFTDLGYDPDKYPWQRLDVSYTPVLEIPTDVPDEVVLAFIRERLIDHIGSEEKVDDMIRAYQETPAYPESVNSVAEEVNLMVARGETLGIINDHLEKGNYRDVVVNLGVLAVASQNVALRSRMDVLLGFPLTRQAVNGKSVAQETINAAGIIWTMQNTDNRKSRPFPGLAVRVIAKGMNDAIEQRQAEGGLAIAVVPSGTGTNKVPNEFGNEVYERSDVTPSVGIMRWWDGILPVAIRDGAVIPGPIHKIDKLSDEDEKKLTRRQRKIRGETMVYAALDTLSQNEANLTHTPVRYQSTGGEIKTVYPQ
jgi:hypothetical protein